MLREVYQDTESRMKGAIQALEEDLGTIRTGRASPSLVEKLRVEYYGAPTLLIQLASISVPEPRSLLIRPFDASTLKAIERAILASDLGLTPNNDGKGIRLNLPPLTEERRHELSALRTVPDSEICSRFPRLVVPTYAGDEAWFASDAFRSLLPSDWPLEFTTLDQIMKR